MTQLRIVHLYDDLLNLYGDCGNITCLEKRCLWRGIDVSVDKYGAEDRLDLDRADILFIGGGSDREQKIVANGLLEIKDELRAYVEDGGVLLAVCGGYQLLGHYYQAEGERMEGLSLVDCYTVSGQGRLIGNIVLKSNIGGADINIVGFENHGGRTFIGNCKSLGAVISGFGNNGDDGKEGIIYKNLIGTYLHGPVLPKNPKLADYIIQMALERKYGGVVNLPELDDFHENRANSYIVNRFATGNGKRGRRLENR